MTTRISHIIHILQSEGCATNNRVHDLIQANKPTTDNNLRSALSALRAHHLATYCQTHTRVNHPTCHKLTPPHQANQAALHLNRHPHIPAATLARLLGVTGTEARALTWWWRSQQ
jgi:hypothetical protein